ncbi:hypothetical protein DYB32_006050 [Aphanomyces invadans]|uniref:Rab-GAP TBC domain-containing protein n=1 Tax=Aphanomyces invadans TaxID=157072 RepID=A0A418ASK7_9STRA|nr:hypothetical protein DYB32_006050 [Aphanomyces invadans]
MALLSGLPIMDKKGRLLTCRYDRLKELRRMVIVYGLPANEPDEDVENALTLRGRIWKMLLGMEDDNAATTERKQDYKRSVAKGASVSDSEIRNDTFRTFRGDPSFARRVPETTLVRVLNAFLHEHGMSCRDGRADSDQPFRYFQGMNILSGIFLYVLPEDDAYLSFSSFVTKHCPRYVAPQLAGVHLDYKLYKHLLSRGITAKVYAYPIILSFFACIPPLSELLHIWDVVRRRVLRVHAPFVPGMDSWVSRLGYKR